MKQLKSDESIIHSILNLRDELLNYTYSTTTREMLFKINSCLYDDMPTEKSQRNIQRLREITEDLNNDLTVRVDAYLELSQFCVTINDLVGQHVYIRLARDLIAAETQSTGD